MPSSVSSASSFLEDVDELMEESNDEEEANNDENEQQEVRHRKAVQMRRRVGRHRRHHYSFTIKMKIQIVKEAMYQPRNIKRTARRWRIQPKQIRSWKKVMDKMIEKAEKNPRSLTIHMRGSISNTKPGGCH